MKTTENQLTQNFTSKDPSEFGFEDFSDSEIPATPDNDKFNLHSIESSVMNKGTVKKSDYKYKRYSRYYKTNEIQRASKASGKQPQ